MEIDLALAKALINNKFYRKKKVYVLFYRIATIVCNICIISGWQSKKGCCQEGNAASKGIATTYSKYTLRKDHATLYRGRKKAHQNMHNLEIEDWHL